LQENPLNDKEKEMEFIKAIIYAIASALMLGAIIFAPAIAGTVAIFYVSILSGYLGLDIWGMIKTTTILPPGEYKSMKINRYILCAISYAVLICASYWQTSTSGVNLDSALSVFVCAIFLMVALLIGGLEGNKIATGVNVESSPAMTTVAASAPGQAQA
jgi:glucan phosphoethanolaminetransferase (alkaline phosphatase superfamily)